MPIRVRIDKVRGVVQEMVSAEADAGLPISGDAGGDTSNITISAIVTATAPADAAAEALDIGRIFGRVVVEPLGTGATDLTRLEAIKTAVAASWPIECERGTWYDGSGVISMPLNPWQYQATWYIDSSAGNDLTGDGSVTYPIATIAEWQRRTGQAPTVDQTLNIIGNITSLPTIVIIGQGRVRIVGSLTQDETGLIGSYTAESAATNTSAFITKAAGDWSTHVGKFVYFVERNAWAVITKDLNTGAHDAAIMPPVTFSDNWDRYGSAATPQTGDTYRVYSCASVITASTVENRLETHNTQAGIVFENFRFASAGVETGVMLRGGPNVLIKKCWMCSGGEYLTSEGGFVYANCAFGTASTKYDHTISSAADAGGVPTFNACCAFGNGNLRFNFYLTTKALIRAQGVRCQGSFFSVYTRSHVRTLGAISVYDSSVYGVHVRAKGHLDMHDSGAKIYGNNNVNFGVCIGPMASITGISNVKLYISGSAGQLSVGGSTNLLTALIPSGGLVLPPAKACTTWAQLFGSDFSGKAMNHDNGAIITSDI